MTLPTYITEGIWGEYSPDGTQIAFSRFSDTDLGADSTGTFQLFVADADGSNEVCLSSSFLTTHCGMASWHPSGDWLVVSREMTVGYDGVHFNANPGKGIFVNLWAVRPDGTDWTQLTAYATTRDGSPMHSPIGALQARFSHSGDKLAWTRKIGTDAALPFAYWDVVTTAFSLPSDVPTIDTEDASTPGSGTFYEVWDWSDDDTKLLLGSDVGSIPAYLDAQIWTFADARPVSVTGPNKEWDEQCFLSPTEARIAVTSTRGQGYDPHDFWGTLNQDIWLMDAGIYGKNAERITFFNDPTHLHYFPRSAGVTVRATANQWTDDGRLLINVVQNLADDQYHSSAQLWYYDVDEAFTGLTTEVVLTPDQDTFILDATPTTNYGSNALIAVGDSSAAASTAYRMLMQFDTSSVPSSATVISASLRLYEYAAYDRASLGSWDVELYRLLRSWVGSEATWNKRTTTDAWSSAGADETGKDVDSTVLDTITLDGVAEAGFVEWTGLGLLDLVQKWVSGDWENNGIAFAALTAESQGTTPMASNLFRSANYTIPEHLPRLVIVYETEEVHDISLSSTLDLLDAPRYGFTFRFESIDPDTSAATDITGIITSVDSFWQGETQPFVYGWSIGVSGINYDRVLLAPGTKMKLYRRFTISGVDVDGELLWFEGYIQPGSISTDYAQQAWALSFVDIVTYLSVRQNPIFAVGKLNIASAAAVIADSSADSRDHSDEGEYIGLPPLSASQAIDDDLGTLWISAKSPAMVEVPFSQRDLRQVSEVYEPGFGLDRYLYQWIEICAPGEYADRTLQIRTRWGGHIPAVMMGEPYGPGPDDDNKMRFAIVGNSAERFQQLFGTVEHAPYFAMPPDWGFNLDGGGDFIALHPSDQVQQPGHPGWLTMFVQDGPRMGAAATGVWTGEGGAWVEVEAGTFAENELEGWFIQYDYDPVGLIYWSQCRIQSNLVTSGATTRLYVNYGFDPDPEWGGEIRLTPFPAGLIPEWPLGDRLYPISPGISLRHRTTGVFAGKGAWVEDASPQPGWSGIPPDAAEWSWIRVSPAEMSFALTSPLDDGETDVYLGGTDGLLETGDVYIGGVGPLAYISKEIDTITLASAWSAGTTPIGTLVYQARNNAIETRWPIKTAVIKRRPIPTDRNVYGSSELRTIRELRTFISNVDSPADPGSNEYWRGDWITGLSVWGFNGNEAITNTWDIPDGASWVDENNYLRVRHILFAIKSMSDESGGRINEIELIPPAAVLAGGNTNMTVVGVFRYILEAMGVDTANIQYANASTEYLAPFSTDTSSYINVLSDLAKRTGQVVWPGPKEDKVRVSWNPGWPIAPPSSPWVTLSDENLRSARITQRDNRSISQVVVTVRDQDGNTAIGQYPPVPREDGEVLVEESVYSAPLDQAGNIARWYYWDKVYDTVEVVTVGPAPWARPGEYTVTLDWQTPTGVNLYGKWVIAGVQHEVLLSDPRSLVSTLQLKRSIQ